MKVSLKLEIDTMSRALLGKCSNGGGSTQKSAMIQWKWLTQDYAARGMQDIQSVWGCSFPLGLTVELCEELLDFIVTWAVPCEDPSTN